MKQTFNISKEMYNKELQPMFYSGLKFISLANKKRGIKLLHKLVINSNKIETYDDIEVEEMLIKRNSDNSKIRVCIFKPKKSKDKLHAMLYCHGGGYFMGSPEQSIPFYRDIIKRRNIAIIAPAYRLSTCHPFPSGFNDCYDTMLWMKNNSNNLNIYPDNFIVAGHSAGGGMAVALTLKARDTKEINVAFQMPIYPMLDYRMTTYSAKNMIGTPYWSRENSQFAWKLYLKNLSNVPVYASPGINEEFKNLPPTISFVGDLEPFKDESINFIKSLKKEKIPVIFKVFKGAFHGFETIAPYTRIAKKGNKFQIDAFAKYFDKYCKI